MADDGVSVLPKLQAAYLHSHCAHFMPDSVDPRATRNKFIPVVDARPGSALSLLKVLSLLYASAALKRLFFFFLPPLHFRERLLIVHRQRSSAESAGSKRNTPAKNGVVLNAVQRNAPVVEGEICNSMLHV